MKRAIGLLLAALLLFTAAGPVRAEGYTEVSPAGKEGQGTMKEDSGEILLDGVLFEVVTATGPYVWQITDGMLRCTDAQSKELLAETPVAALYGTPDYLDVTAFGGGVIVCTVTGALDTGCKVFLDEMALEGGVIRTGRHYDATAQLGFLFDGAEKWLEVDLVGYTGGLAVTAMNPEFVYQLYAFHPETEELKPFGTQPLSELDAVLADGASLLLVGPSAGEPGLYEITRINPETGERSIAGSFRTGSASQPLCSAWDPETGILCFCVDGVGYRVNASGSEETPSPLFSAPEGTAWIRYAAVAAGSYILQDEDGELQYQSLAQETKSKSLRILDLTGTELTTEAMQAFNASSPDYLALVSQGEETDDVLNAMMNQSADYDAYVLSLGSDLYGALYRRGYLGDLGSSAVLKEAAATFPERIRSRITDGDRLTAFPAGIVNSVVLLDTEAVTALTGKTREEIPTDWPGFLALLQEIGDCGQMEAGHRYLYEPGISSETMRMILLTTLLQDAMLWLNRDDARLDRLEAVLTPALNALDQMNWEALGLSEDENEDTGWMMSEDEYPLIEWTTPEIGLMSLREGVEYWPLSLAEGEEKLIPQDVAVVVLNPWSAQADGVARYTETLWQEMGAIARMELDLSLAAPVENDNFDEEMTYLKNLLPLYEAAIADADEAGDTEEAADLRAEKKQMESMLEAYEQVGMWLVSDASIALYRPLEELFAIHGDEFWTRESESTLFLQYADGMLNADQFVMQMANTIRMERMEAE